jgi:hypothetical protein
MHTLPSSISERKAKSKIFAHNFSFLSDNFSLWGLKQRKTAPNALGKWWMYRAEQLCGRACLFSLLNSYQILEKLFERGEKLSEKCQFCPPFDEIQTSAKNLRRNPSFARYTSAELNIYLLYQWSLVHSGRPGMV